MLLSTAHLTLRGDGPARKLQDKYCGPFNVTEKISAVAYRLALPSTMKVHPVFHVSLLRPHNESATFPQRDGDDRPPPAFVEAGEEHYLVEKLLEERTRGQGRSRRREFLVKWKGYPYYEATWEPESNLTGLDAYQEFIASRTMHSPSGG